MSYPEQNPQEPKVLPGYFSPAAAPPQAEQAPAAPAAPPYPPVPQPEAQYQPAYLFGNVQPNGQPQQYGQQQGQPSALSQPLYPASFLESMGRFYGKYATFSGRASRSEFWWVQLFMAGLFFVGAMFNAVTGADWVAGVYVMFVLGSIVPYIALTFRRLHDANFSGALGALWLVPYVGFLIVGILALMPSNPQGTRFEKVLVRPAPYGQQRY
ncbi:hypothetical protein ART_0768 [Arthrobacter sp. PAMC 25486]|uniref:DUF805 domain-containing protein n=1 Tax=Arthrobacter sp. PAMC 25486 TaxID=1494608 RepID=UPI0005360284|nr:DUF805 domain-containing protein [Arthrobacter sp. PAMC 25486]AIY00367.1 hypothetical protein ART_0768 [Arthrobacter sp. PAMC 25486]